MFQSNQQNLTYQINLLRNRFFQGDKAPLNKILSEERVSNIVQQEVEAFRERFFSPITTLTTFLKQVLSQDHSCRNAVATAVAESVEKKRKALFLCHWILL